MTSKEFITMFMSGNNSLTTIITATNGGEIVLTSEPDWATIRNAASGSWLEASQTIIGVGKDEGGTNYRLNRSFGLFDLSSVPGTIISAYVKLDNSYTFNNCDYVSIQSANNTGTLVLGDYSNFVATLLGYDNIKGIIGSDPQNIVSFNAAGITKLNEKGTQRFIFRQGENDYSDVAPTATNASGLTDIYRLPVLYITYE